MRQATLTMAGLAALCGFLLIIVDGLTSTNIADNQQRFSERQQREIWQSRSLQRDDTFSLVPLDDQSWKVLSNDAPIGFLYRFTTLGGYNGAITLWVGVQNDGVVQGVRVIHHRETPGLGDKIDRRVSSWIDTFHGRSVGSNDATSWEVTKHGGVFDQFTGATITPRAVVHAVRDVLVLHDLKHATVVTSADITADPDKISTGSTR